MVAERTRKRIVRPSATRVPASSPPEANQRIQRQTEMNVAYYVAHPDQIQRRLQELDAEWDIERLLEANAASLTCLSVLLGTFRNRLWLWFPAIIGGFLLQHALQGWCPPVELARRLGFRTRREIDTEFFALQHASEDAKRKQPAPK